MPHHDSAPPPARPSAGDDQQDEPRPRREDLPPELLRRASFTFHNGLLTPKHFSYLGGTALWHLVVLVNWQTDPTGLVYYGKPVTAAMLAAMLGCHERTSRRAMQRIQVRDYAQFDAIGDGWRIRIKRPKKFFRNADKSVHRSRTEMSDPADKSVRSLLSSPKVQKAQSTQTGACDAIFITIEKEHPGSNPRPEVARQRWRSRFGDDLDTAQEALNQHQQLWQPQWATGRWAPDLDNWIRDYDPHAKIAPRRRPGSERQSMEERLRRIRNANHA